MNITNLSSNELDQYQQKNLKTEASIQDLKSFAELDPSKMSKPELDAVKEKCAEFESIFIKMMLEEMRKSIKQDSSGSKALDQGKDIFNEMLYEQYAKQISHDGNGMGLGRMIYDQLTTPKIPASEVIKRYNNS